MARRRIHELRRGRPFGTAVDVDAPLAAALVRQGTHAYADTEPEPVRPPSYSTKDETADISPRTGKPKRKYRRRDMQAEG